VTDRRNFRQPNVELRVLGDNKWMEEYHTVTELVAPPLLSTGQAQDLRLKNTSPDRVPIDPAIGNLRAGHFSLRV
jgi:hypothetical protein